MKYIICIFCYFVGLNFAFTQAVFQFDKTDHNFGNIKEGALATHEFTFKNTGDKVLLINNVRPSCGCTSPQWPKEAIAPGEEGKIKVVYNSNGRPGAFYKSVTITSNANPSVVKLHVRGIASKKTQTSAPKTSQKAKPQKVETKPVEKKATTPPQSEAKKDNTSGKSGG